MKELNLVYLKALSKKCRYDIVRMIDGAGSGHLGGSMSSVDIYIILQYIMEDNDRLVISHGHTSAGVYAVLGNMGYFDVEDAVRSFRREAPYEGHPSIQVNGVDWCSGSLGQGLSVGCGFALAKKLKKEPGKVYVVMGDGEQQKGQLQEAREFAVKYGLDNLIAIVDDNGLQASGSIENFCRKSVKDKYDVCGWKTVAVDGHSFEQMYECLKDAGGPLCVLATTTMSKGIPQIEGDYRYHGTLISDELVNDSLARFQINEEEWLLIRENTILRNCKKYEYPVFHNTGENKRGNTAEGKAVYMVGDKVDIRTAMGRALKDVATENPHTPIAVLDCDLEGSLKLTEFKRTRGPFFVECGIAEHNAATVAAAMAKSGVIALHADFSLFNIAETYSQIRMADINKAPVKLFSTHAGLDVGEDGKTHQCIDYLSLLSNLYGFQVIVPADANQAEQAVRYALTVDSPVAIVAGRSKVPVLELENGETLNFEYGKTQWIRSGSDGVIITYGNLVYRAVKIADELKNDGLNIGVLNCSSPLEIDEEAIVQAADTGLVVTYEDHNVKSGVAGVISKFLLEKDISCKFLAKGISKYGASASPDKLYKEQGLDENSMIQEIKRVLSFS